MPHIGLDFNGSTDYVSCGGDTSLLDITNITLSCWVKAPSSASTTYYSILGTKDTAYKGYFFRTFSNDKIVFTVGNITTANNAESGISVYDNTWHYITGTWDGTTAKIYVDGVLKNSDTGESYQVSTNDVEIGRDSLHTTYFLNGIIDDVRIWDRALSLEEVVNCYRGTAPRNGLVAEWLMNEGSGATIYDTSENSNDGTITGATWGNNLNHNPLIINVQMTEAEITRDVYITGFHWTGVSDGDLCSVKDNCTTPKQIWKAEAGADGFDVSFKPQQPIPANGIYVDDLDGGTLFINLTSSYR